jgi:hypothetical protein
MRFRWQPAVLAMTVMFTGALEAQVSNQGAKELFYDPTEGNVVSNSASPSAPGRPAAAKSPAAKSVRLGGDGRRQINLPTAGSAQGGQPAALRRAQGSQKVLGVSYWIELVDGSGGPGTQVTNERIFRSGERIRLHFRGNVDGHIALIHLGSSGTSTVLFPDPEKQLTDSALVANDDRILPSSAHWFRFDDNPGVERILVLFARNRDEIDRFPVKPRMDEAQTSALLASTQHIQGSKDLIVETETQKVAEIGTYGVNVAGKPVVLEITLKHR